MYKVFRQIGDTRLDSLLLVDRDFWVWNGNWKLIRDKDGILCAPDQRGSPSKRYKFECIGQTGAKGDYNEVLNKFRKRFERDSKRSTNTYIPEPLKKVELRTKEEWLKIKNQLHIDYAEQVHSVDGHSSLETFQRVKKRMKVIEDQMDKIDQILDKFYEKYNGST